MPRDRDLRRATLRDRTARGATNQELGREGDRRGEGGTEGRERRCPEPLRVEGNEQDGRAARRSPSTRSTTTRDPRRAIAAECALRLSVCACLPPPEALAHVFCNVLGMSPLMSSVICKHLDLISQIVCSRWSTVMRGLCADLGLGVPPLMNCCARTTRMGMYNSIRCRHLMELP